MTEAVAVGRFSMSVELVGVAAAEAGAVPGAASKTAATETGAAEAFSMFFSSPFFADSEIVEAANTTAIAAEQIIIRAVSRIHRLFFADACDQIFIV